MNKPLKIWRNTTDGKNQTISVWPDRKIRTGYYEKDFWSTLTRPESFTDEEWCAKPIGEGWQDITNGYVPDDGPDGFELPDGTETWEGSYPVQQPQHSPEIGRNHPEGTTTILNLDLWHLEKRATHADKLAEALRDMLADSRSLEIRHYAEAILAEYQNAKGGE